MRAEVAEMAFVLFEKKYGETLKMVYLCTPIRSTNRKINIR
jgi:hypothetical protein